MYTCEIKMFCFCDSVNLLLSLVTPDEGGPYHIETSQLIETSLMKELKNFNNLLNVIPTY